MQIISGGQTGVDRAALDVALAIGLPVGGWCPRGRRAEDGPIPARYPLSETPETDYASRTRLNVEAADGTLILVQGVLAGGTALTAEHARSLGKPLLIVALDRDLELDEVRAWLASNRIQVLNVAGPRESEGVGVYDAACQLLGRLLEGVAQAKV